VEGLKNSLKQVGVIRVDEQTGSTYTPSQVQFSFEDSPGGSSSPTSSSSGFSTPPLSPPIPKDLPIVPLQHKSPPEIVPGSSRSKTSRKKATKRKGKRSATSEKRVSRKRKSPETVATKKRRSPSSRPSKQQKQPKSLNPGPPVQPLPQERFPLDQPKSTQSGPQNTDQRVTNAAMHLLMHRSRIELLGVCDDKDFPLSKTDSIFLYALAQIYHFASNSLRGKPLCTAGVIDFTLRYHLNIAEKELARIKYYKKSHDECLSKLGIYNSTTGQSTGDGDKATKGKSYEFLGDFDSIPAMI
jgi:hypothetical protein